MKRKKREHDESKPVIQLPDQEEMEKRLLGVSSAILYTSHLYPKLYKNAGNKVDPDDLALMVINAVQSVKRNDSIELSEVALRNLTNGNFLSKIVKALVKDLPKETYFWVGFSRQAHKHSNLVHY